MISKTILGHSKVKTVRVYVWTSLTIILFISKGFSKVKQVVCSVNLSLKVFQTDPVCFCLKSNVLGSDQAYLQVRFPLEATKMELKSRRIPYIYWYWFISAVCCIDLNVYSDVAIYNFCIKLLFRCD